MDPGGNVFSQDGARVSLHSPSSVLLRRVKADCIVPRPSWRFTTTSIAQTVRLLAVAAQAGKTSDGSQGQPKGSEGEEGSQGESRPALAATADPTTGSQSTESSTALSIIITLHPSDLEKVLAAPSTAESRTAWLEGLPNASGLRLSLRPHLSPASKPTSRPCKDSSSRVWRQFYAEARTWWEGV